jgi:nucleotide-binding universal stress UspA family protein
MSIRSWWSAGLNATPGPEIPRAALNRQSGWPQSGRRTDTQFVRAQSTFWSDFARREDESIRLAKTDRKTKPLSILVPTDFAPSSLLALDCALRMAAHQPACITLLHAIHLNLMPYGPVNVGELKTNLCREALAKAEPILLAARNLGVNAVCMLDDGPPARAIADTAQRCAPDLVIMTNRRRGVLARWFGRGTVEKVTHTVHCPVLVLPAA